MKKSFRVLLALAATSAVFVGFQNFTSAQISQTAIIPPAGVKGNFDVRGGYLRTYIQYVKIDVDKCLQSIQETSHWSLYTCDLGFSARSNSSVSFPSYGKNAGYYDQETDTYLATTEKIGTVRINFSYVVPPGASIPSNAGALNRASVEARVKTLAAKYGYIRLSGTIEDSSTLPTISRQ